MSKQTTHAPQYMVSVYEQPNVNHNLVFTFVPKAGSGADVERGAGAIPQFIVAVEQGTGPKVLDWSGTRDEPGPREKEWIEAEISARVKDRALWIDRVDRLVAQLEQWGNELGWSTRRLEKQLDDARIGKHRLPVLLMQEGTCKVLLEPVGRSTPAAEGVVDLYLMPAYDDIASFYFYQDRWNLHYMFAGTNSVATTREAPPTPLTKKALEKVLAEMRQHAA